MREGGFFILNRPTFFEQPRRANGGVSEQAHVVRIGLRRAVFAEVGIDHVAHDLG